MTVSATPARQPLAARPTRRALLAGAASAALCSAAQAQSFCADADSVPAAIRRETPLGALNERAAWGVAIGAPGLYDPRLTELIASEKPRYLAMANALKFGNLHANAPLAGSDLGPSATWGECDDILALAARWRIPVRGDCLVWNDWIPDWIKKLDASDARTALREHVAGVFAHIVGRIERGGAPTLAWSGVVNEPFNPWSVRGGVPGWREGAWLTAFGLEPDGVPGYIHAAFEAADKAANPRTNLFINETNCDNDRYGPIVRPAMLSLVDRLQRAGRRVDAVGLECHLMPQWMTNPSAPDWRPFVSFLDDLGRRGVAVYLTELDVSDCSVRDARARDTLVANTMRSFVSAALQSPAVAMVTNWDLSDRYSWWREQTVFGSMGKWADCVRDPPCPRPTPYDAAMQPKSARDALADALSSRR